MRLYGPVTVVHGTETLPKTFGGVSLELETINNQALVVSEIADILVGGTGAINFYSWPGTLTFTSSMLLKAFGVVTLTGVGAKITLYNCQIWFDKTLQLGNNTQQAIKTKLVFKPNGSNQIIKLEEV